MSQKVTLFVECKVTWGSKKCKKVSKKIRNWNLENMKGFICISGWFSFVKRQFTRVNARKAHFFSFFFNTICIKWPFWMFLPIINLHNNYHLIPCWFWNDIWQITSFLLIQFLFLYDIIKLCLFHIKQSCMKLCKCQFICKFHRKSLSKRTLYC